MAAPLPSNPNNKKKKSRISGNDFLELLKLNRDIGRQDLEWQIGDSLWQDFLELFHITGLSMPHLAVSSLTLLGIDVRFVDGSAIDLVEKSKPTVRRPNVQTYIK